MSCVIHTLSTAESAADTQAAALAVIVEKVPQQFTVSQLVTLQSQNTSVTLVVSDQAVESLQLSNSKVQQRLLEQYHQQALYTTYELLLLH